MLTFLLLWVLFRGEASATMLYRPRNLVVRAGESLQMSCRWGNESIDWYHKAIGSSAEKKINDENLIVSDIFNGATLNGGIPGQKLTIRSAQKQHAGLYTCTSMVQREGDLVETEKAAAHVVFIDADPVCQMRSSAFEIEKGIIEMCCMLSYTGSLLPTMKWSLDNGNNKLKERVLNVTSVISQSNVISTLTTVADFNLHRSRFICETVFEISSTGMNPILANNTPDYNYTWKSSYVQVIYGPQNLRITPPVDVFYPGDIVTCFAEGNPIPEYLWLNTGTNDVIHGPRVTIVDAMIRDEPYEFRCRATNPTTNHTLEVSTGFAVKQRCTSSNCQQHSTTVVQLKIVVFVTIAVSAAIIASLSVYIIVTKRKRRRDCRAVPITEGRPCNEVNPKTPLSRVSRYNMSLPLPSRKFLSLDNSDYLSPRPLPSVDYDEISDVQGIATQNAIYLEIAPEASTQPAYLPSQMPRPINEYQEAAGLEPTAKPTIYEILKSR